MKKFNKPNIISITTILVLMGFLVPMETANAGAGSLKIHNIDIPERIEVSSTDTFERKVMGYIEFFPDRPKSVRGRLYSARFDLPEKGKIASHSLPRPFTYGSIILKVKALGFTKPSFEHKCNSKPIKLSPDMDFQISVSYQPEKRAVTCHIVSPH